MTMRDPRHAPLLATVFGVGAVLVAGVFEPAYQLRYNASTSAPLGWYLRTPPRDLSVNRWVFARLPHDVAAMAARRHYLPQTVPVLKQVAAVAGQTVCAHDGALYIDGLRVARARTIDGAGRGLAPWQGCRPLRADELMLLNPGDTSFDGRYFGPILREAVLGNALPLWTW